MLVADDDPIAVAVAHFRREMRAYNMAVLADKIRPLMANQALTDRQRLDKLASHFDNRSKWPTSGYLSDITSPEQLLTVEEIGDGTIPPAPEERRELYLAELMSMLRDTAGEKDFEPPTEFIKLLTLADAIGDPDNIRLKFPSVVGVNYRLTRYSRLDDHPGQGDWYNDGWQVITGWMCGDGTTTSATFLLYAYKYSGGTLEEQVPQWRVYTWSEDDELWFPSIADFVYFRCRWKEWMPGGLPDDMPDVDWLFGADGE